jgi:hypothetical protein
VRCGRCSNDPCYCDTVDSLTLPKNVTGIVKVTVDGVVLPESAYRLAGNRLWRLDGGYWPVCQEISKPSTEVGTWELVYSTGTPVPVGGEIAAGVLACELAKAACGDPSCGLPARWSSVQRQGVSINALSAEELTAGRTGLWLVDSWVQSVTGTRKASAVYSPDTVGKRSSGGSISASSNGGTAGPPGPPGRGVHVYEQDTVPTDAKDGDIWITATDVAVLSNGTWHSIVGPQGVPGAEALDDLTDVAAPADTQVGLVLGVTAPGQWAPVSIPTELPVTTEPVPYLFKTQGVQGVGQATRLMDLWIAFHNTDANGVTHDWVATLKPGDPFVFGPADALWTGTIATINTAAGAIPQQLVDTWVASGMTLVHPAEGFPPVLADGTAVVLGPVDTGKVLTVVEDGVAWAVLPAPAPVPQALDDLTDVDVHLAATGMLLTKQIDGSWKGANFTRPLNWLTDVVAPDNAEGVLGTTAPGVWEPLPMDHLQQQIVGPLPSQVAGLDARVTALEATPEPTPVDFALTVDNYSGGFTRVINAQVIGTETVRVTVALATTPGVNGAVFPDLSAISGTANVWADFAGTLGRVEDALTGTPIHGAALKEVIRRGTVVLVRRDNTDPSHPTLQVEGTEAAGTPGTSLTLASLADVDNSAATAPAGQVLGTTATGQWGPVAHPAAWEKWTGSQAAYDALPTKSPDVLYVITP